MDIGLGIDPYIAPRSSSRKLQGCTVGDGIIECETTSRNCEKYEFDGCKPVYCIDGNSCSDATFLESSVFCQAESACESAKITDSLVDCAVGYACADARIVRSTVSCSVAYNCRASYTASVITGQVDTWSSFTDDCTCCGGTSCPDWLPRCKVNGSPSTEFVQAFLMGYPVRPWEIPFVKAWKDTVLL